MIETKATDKRSKGTEKALCMFIRGCWGLKEVSDDLFQHSDRILKVPVTADSFRCNTHAIIEIVPYQFMTSV